MKKALVVLLVVLVLVTGLPILMGMSGMATCHDCDVATLLASCVAAVLAIFSGLLITPLALRLRAWRAPPRLLLHAFLLEQPPQLV